MIAQGTNGISCGDLGNGIMSGKSMLNFVPLNEGVESRAPWLVTWFIEACGEEWEVLEPKE